MSFPHYPIQDPKNSFITGTQSREWDGLTNRLTHYLKFILKGNASIHIIGTVNQEDRHIMETLNTLNFISKAKRIEIQPKMNFQTKNDNIKERQLANLLEKVQLLEANSKILKTENENLQRKFEMERKKEEERIRDKDALIKDLKERVAHLEKSVEHQDLNKTVVVKSKRFTERKSPKKAFVGKIGCVYNYLHPILKKEKKRYPRLNSIIYNSQDKDKLKFLDNFNKSIDFGKIC
jgi:hypothetical protein